MRTKALGPAVAGLIALVALACGPSQSSSTSGDATGDGANAPAAQATEDSQQPTGASPTSAAGGGQGEAAATRDYDEAAVADFYRGKTVRIVVGSDAGSTLTLAARMVGDRLSQYIPGNPSVVAEAMPGGGGLIAANQSYNTLPKDGTVISMPLEGVALQQLMGAEGIEFDASKFQWLGSLWKSPRACVARTDSGVDSIEDIISGGEELTVGTSGFAGTTYETPAILKAAIGANFNMITGYAGSAEGQLALENGEIEGQCLSFNALLSAYEDRLQGDSPFVKFIVVMGAGRPDHPTLEGVPQAEDYTDSEEAAAMLQTVAAAADISGPMAVAPEVPADRVAALRDAFDKAMADAGLQEEMVGFNRPLEPGTGEYVQSVVEEILSVSPDIAEDVRAALLPNQAR